MLTRTFKLERFLKVHVKGPQNAGPKIKAAAVSLLKWFGITVSVYK